MRLRTQLSATVAGAAGPYGYTISLGGSIALSMHHLGSPGYGRVMLMMAGAVLAFVALELFAQGSMRAGEPPREASTTVWGNAHLPSAGGAISSVWGLIHAVHGPGAWAVVGFVSTFVYFAVTALQRVAVAAVRERRDQAAASSAASSR